MKIEDLIGEMKFNPRRSQKSISGIITSPKLEYIANGCQAIAYFHNTHPNTVVKVAAVTGENDPIWQFLRLCVNHPKNPYFPKVFNYKVFNLKHVTPDEEAWLEDKPGFEYLPIHDNRPLQILMVTERLNEIQPQQHDAALTNAGVMPLIQNTMKHLQSKSKFKIHPELAFNKLMDSPQGRVLLRKRATDKYFADAVRLLSPLLATGTMYADLHLGNIMIRDNGQVVFNDPLAFITSGD